MEITQQAAHDHLRLVLRGRLDATWSDETRAVIERCLRQGAHNVLLDLSGVPYISSAGIRVLVASYKQMHAAGGALRVVEPSQQVRQVLELSGLHRLLDGVQPPAAPTPAQARARQVATPSAAWEHYGSGGALQVRVLGLPRLDERAAGAGDCVRVPLPATAAALGVGAFGSDFEDSRARLGECVAVGGVAVCHPAGGGVRPDYMVAERDLVPELQFVSGIVVEGTWSGFSRFVSKPDTGRIALSEVLDACLAETGTDAAAVVVAGETSGVVGAALRRSPATGSGWLAAGVVRDWLSFTPEPIWAGFTVLALGIVVRGDAGPLAPYLRPCGGGKAGHAHGAVLPFRPLRSGQLDLAATCGELFDGQVVQGVLHLLHDDRPGLDPACTETGFVRGVCWHAPLLLG